MEARMKNRIKRGAGCVCFLGLTTLMLYGTSKLLESKKAVVKYHEFYDCDTDIDVIFMGTSHMYNSLLPQELWDEYGITSYNWGYSNCTLPEDYYILQDIVKEHKPKVVVVDIFGLFEYEKYVNGKYRDDRIEQQHVQFDMIPPSLNKYRAMNDVFGPYEGKWDFMFDFLMYHNRWEKLKEPDFEPEYSTEKGAEYLKGVGDDAEYYRAQEFEQLEFNTVCAGYIQPIADFCSENDIELLYVFNPCLTNVENINAAYSLDSYMEEKGLAYYNALYLEEISSVTDFCSDSDHLNYSGAVKYTRRMGDVLKEQYGIEDHRGEEGYASWDESYARYLEYKIQNIQETENVHDVLMLSADDDFKVNLQFDPSCSFALEDTRFVALVQNLGSSIEVIPVNDLKYEENSCQILITVMNSETGDIVAQQGYAVGDDGPARL